MSTYTPTPDEPSTLTIWDTDTIALGGVNGPMNLPLKTLANNIAWLKDAVETLQSNMLTVVPVGTIIAVPYTTPPTGFLEADGSAILISEYSALAEVLYCGNTDNPTASWGYRCANADGSGHSTSGTYIVLPDLRGQFIRGLDNGRDLDTDRSLWAAQNDAMGFNLATNLMPVLGVFVQTLRTPRFPVSDAIDGLEEGVEFSKWGSVDYSITRVDGDFAAETRPTNIALMYCIKY